MVSIRSAPWEIRGFVVARLRPRRAFTPHALAVHCVLALLLCGARPALAADPPFPGPSAPLELAEADRRARAGEMVEARRLYERLAAGSDPAIAAEATKRRPRVERALDAWGRVAKAFGRLRVAQTELPPADGDDLLAQLLGPSSHPGSVVDALRYDE
ncbi:MAG: hypothetical protein HYZ53_23670, partial [Planctomycetes bacterium]|nr:hypothetical protein [Planctomycetota bacterium]